MLEFLRLDALGERKPEEAHLFSNAVGEPIADFDRAWAAACRRAGIVDLRWHDLRHEYASRLVERGVPLSQVRDLLGHASIVTPERYDNQRPEALFEAAARLESVSEASRNFQELPPDGSRERTSNVADATANSLQDLDLEDGVSDGIRTRDGRSHSPELYP